MKLATIPRTDARDPTKRRDGRLVLVDDQAGRFVAVPDDVAPNLWSAVQDWPRAEPRLREMDRLLRAGDLGETHPIEGQTFLAPLPRTTSWLDGSAYIQHIVLVRKARGAEPPEDLRKVPLMYQGVGDPLYGPTEPIVARSESDGIDFEAEVAVVTDDVPMGTPAADAEKHIRLLCLMNDVSLRALIPRELAAGFGFFHGKPPSHFAPFAVTPDELGDAWRDGRVHLPMLSWRSDEKHGDPDAGPEMFFSFHQLIEHAAATRPLPAGTIIGSGTVSNEDTKRGCSCIAEKRMLETIEAGKPTTPFLRFGETVRIDMQQDGRSVFGAIVQEVVQGMQNGTGTAADAHPDRSGGAGRSGDRAVAEARAP